MDIVRKYWDKIKIKIIFPTFSIFKLVDSSPHALAE